jgi:hypothetical protein
MRRVTQIEFALRVGEISTLCHQKKSNHVGTQKEENHGAALGTEF